MQKVSTRNRWAPAGTVALLAGAAVSLSASAAEGSDKLLDLLIKKGVLTDKEAADVKAEADKTAAASGASKWKINSGIKSIELFGDARFRYEYRGAETSQNDSAARERSRYALRLGLRGNLTDDFYYGLRLETGPGNRSPWVTFGDQSVGAGPSNKGSAGINLGQVYVGWKPTDWVDLTIGKMPNPLYVTSMVWDGDINPEGASEKFKYTVGNFDLFASFGQFVYQDVNPDNPAVGSGFGTLNKNFGDTFLLAWQFGGSVKFGKDMSFKFAPTVYNYVGHVYKNGPIPLNGFDTPFTGEGLPTGANNLAFQTGINNLTIIDFPMEFNFGINKTPLGDLKGRIFGDFAVNVDAKDRAKNAGFPKQDGEDKAYQIGVAVGTLGLTSGQTAKKGGWEARTYWQHVEQYSLDANLLDSDWFEGRANLEGFFAAFAYGITDNITATVRYGMADRINSKLGTGGNNNDLPGLNPIRKYQILQLDLSYKF